MSDLHSRAIRLLARREHGRAELARKLATYGSEAEVTQVLDRLEAEGLLSDTRAAAAFVHAHGPRLGAARLRHDLRARGLDPTLVTAEFDEMDSELDRARVVLEKKFSSPPADERDWARQARFLQGRGFSAETIRTLLKERKP